TKDVMQHAQYSALNWVSENYPPTFLWHTFTDETVPVRNSLRMALALADAGVLMEMHIFPQGRHGLSLANALSCAAWDVSLQVEECAQWPALAARFLKRL
ncbi:MAG: prolyl oligopeptidase family serine peptidase, partial [Clostridia bacterium]|nr:prolyl oligopeptidase family serine peptidase [Clostridia bacterium]